MGMDAYYKDKGSWNRSDRLFRALALDGRMERRARRGSGPYVISLTGGGGKTSLIRRLAWEGMEQGLKVFVTTTTHMAVPLRLGVFSGSGQDVKEMLDREHAVVAGQTNGAGKISYMGDGAYGSLCPLADLVLVEADGAKRLPLKVPRGNEPIIPDNTDLILCVSGLSAAGSLAAEGYGLPDALWVSGAAPGPISAHRGPPCMEPGRHQGTGAGGSRAFG